MTEENLAEKEQIKILKHYISELCKYIEETATILGLDTSATILGKGCIEYWAMLSSASNNAIKKLQQENKELKQSQEQIIIDGVDILKEQQENKKINRNCKYYHPNNKCGLKAWCMLNARKCNVNADYCQLKLRKQLARKTQECKKLNDKIIDMNSIIEDAAINLGNKDFTLYDLPFEIKKLRQECDIWKNQVLVLDEESVTVQVTQEQFEEYQKLKQECEKPSILAQEESARNGRIAYELNDELKQKTQELYFARNEIHSKTEYIQEQRDIIDQLKQEYEEQKTIISTLKYIIKYQEDKLYGYHELVLKMASSDDEL